MRPRRWDKLRTKAFFLWGYVGPLGRFVLTFWFYLLVMGLAWLLVYWMLG